MATTVVENTKEKIEIDENLDALLKSKGIDIKTLAMEAKLLKKAIEEGANEESKAEVQTDKPKIKRAPSAKPEFTLALAKYPDFCIRKTSAKTDRIIAIMPSVNSYYIKDMKNQEIEVLDETSYGKFTQGMTSIKMPDDFWLNEVSGTVYFYRNLMKYLEDESIRELIKINALGTKISDSSLTSRSRYTGINCKIKERAMAYKKNAKLYKEFCAEGKQGNNSCRLVASSHQYDFIADVVERWGLQNARDLLKEIDISLVRINSNGIQNAYFSKYSTNQLQNRDITPYFTTTPIPQVEMEYKAFKEYLIYQSVRTGYALNIKTFLDIWRDDLWMQIQIYGKIKEKYPKDLPLHHQILSYKKTLHQEEIDKNGFDMNSKKCQAYEATVSGFRFITPRCKEDMIDEATQQANCLAGYTSKYAEGSTMIYFMRKKDDIETSYITIEVIDRGDELKLNQVYLAHNQKPSDKDMEIVNKWFKRMCNKYKKLQSNTDVESDEELDADSMSDLE